MVAALMELVIVMQDTRDLSVNINHAKTNAVFTVYAEMTDRVHVTLALQEMIVPNHTVLINVISMESALRINAIALTSLQAWIVQKSLVRITVITTGCAASVYATAKINF